MEVGKRLECFKRNSFVFWFVIGAICNIPAVRDPFTLQCFFRSLEETGTLAATCRPPFTPAPTSRLVRSLNLLTPRDSRHPDSWNVGKKKFIRMSGVREDGKSFILIHCDWCSQLKEISCIVISGGHFGLSMWVKSWLRTCSRVIHLAIDPFRLTQHRNSIKKIVIRPSATEKWMECWRCS